MRKFLLYIFLVVGLFGVSGCSEQNSDYLRIHIRANSNSQEDQNVKYFIKDVVVAYMAPLLENAKSKDNVIDIINNNIEQLTDVVDKVLIEKGFDYKCNICIKNEFFPTRTYEELTLNADYYDALIVNLGHGDGNNWWCVVYPNLCFNEPQNVVYKSKIMEIIEKIKG